MKRFSIILLGALAIAMAGCSKDIAPSSSNPDAWKTDITLPVPVEFGKPSLATKGTYISDLASTAGINFGVFAYDKSIGTLVSTESNECLMYNRLAQYTAENGFKMNQTIYYPMTNEWNYNFYAYYKAKASSDPVNPFIEDNKVYVTYDVGREDILYGNTKVTPEMKEVVGRDGFNGGYIRAVRALEDADKTADDQYAAYNPSISFKHTTAALQFYVKAYSEPAQKVFEDKGIYVSRIALTDIPVKADLCVVDIDADASDETEGVLTGTANGTQYVWTEKEDGTTSSAMQVYPKHKKNFDFADVVGQPVFIVPTTGELKGYLKLSENSLDPIEFTLDPSEMNLTTTGFQAGYRYNITLIVHSPEEVTFNVSVEAWKPGNATETEEGATTPGDYEYELGE